MHEDFSNAESLDYKISDIYMDASFSWVLRKGFSGTIKTIATVKSSSSKSTTIDDGTYSDVSYRYYDSFNDCLAAVRSGEADATYAYTYYAEKLVFDNVRNDLKTRLSNGVSHFCIGTQLNCDVNLLSIINKGINSLTTAEKENIKEKYVDLGEQRFSFVRLAYQYPLSLYIYGYMCIACTCLLVFISALSSLPFTNR